MEMEGAGEDDRIRTGNIAFPLWILFHFFFLLARKTEVWPQCTKIFNVRQVELLPH